MSSWVEVEVGDYQMEVRNAHVDYGHVVGKLTFMIADD